MGYFLFLHISIPMTNLRNYKDIMSAMTAGMVRLLT